MREVQRLEREPLGQEAYQAGLDRVHTEAFSDNNYTMNAVFGVHSPSIGAEERLLPTETRIVLVQ